MSDEPLPVVRQRSFTPKIQEALAAAQGEFPVIPKDSEVRVTNKEGKFLYSYKYADLTTIISCTRPALSKHGLSFTQSYVKNEMGSGVQTNLLHSSGDVLEAGFVPCSIPSNADMKIVAGLFTYAKRISLTAALGVSADEDIDAASTEASSGNSTEKSTLPVASPQILPKPVANFAPNMATKMPPDDFDQFMDSEPPEEYRGGDIAQEIYDYVEAKQIPVDHVKKVIKMYAGEGATTATMTIEQLQAVLKHLKTTKK